MGRNSYIWVSQDDFAGGVNYRPEDASENQVYDARNMWEKDGLLAQRPGYVFAGQSQVSTSSTQDTTGYYADNAQTATTGASLTLSAAAAETKWYIGYTTYPEDAIGMMVTTVSQNAADLFATAEFWNGTHWAPFDAMFEADQTRVDLPSNHLSHVFTAFYAGRPTGWATSTIDSITKYWVRFTLKNNGDAALTNPTVVGVNPYHPLWLQVASTTGQRGLYGARMPGAKFYCAVNETDTYRRFYMNRSLNIVSNPEFVSLSGVKNAELASFVTIPTFRTVFGSYGQDVVEFDTINESVALAKVEDAAYLVGEMGGAKSPYHPDYIATSGAVPAAKYLEYFDSQLWAANMRSNSHELRWSGPDDAFRVWPATSGLTVVEDDQSPITGLKAFGEHLAVFKQDSMWRIVYVGADGLTGLNSYTAVKVPGRIGTVSNASIVDVNGVVLFLAEDGVYAADGIEKPEKISRGIDNMIERINPGRRKFCAAVHWRTENCYLLSVAIDGSETNNLVLVYDYLHGSWWIWDNIEAQCWMSDEDEYDNEKLYFGDKYGRVYRLGEGSLDNSGAITSYVEPHRIAAEEEMTKSFRQTRIYGSAQDVSSLDVVASLDDQQESERTTSTLDWRSSSEAKVGDATSIVGTSTVCGTRRDKLKVVYRKTGDWLSIKIQNDEKGRHWAISKLSHGFTSMGIR